MKRFSKKIVASVVSITLVLSVPIASRVITKVKAEDSWQLEWSDDFNGDSLNSANWTPEIGTGNNGWGNNEKQYYTARSENIEVSNGTLKIKALKENYGGRQYTSARIKTQGKQYFKYGKIEARMKLPRFQGVWPAFWTLGESIVTEGWPKCGEMDIMECINNNNIVFSNLHWSYKNSQADTQNARQYNVGDRTEWHTYGMEWDANSAKFYVDDYVFQTFSITTAAEQEEFRKNQFIILNLAIGGNLPGNSIDDSAFPDRSIMEVDYVKVYKKIEKPTTKYNGPTKVVTEDSVEKYNGEWSEFFGNNIGWIPSTGKMIRKSTNSDGYILDITSVGNIDNDSQWSVQGNLESIPYIKGATYTYKCTLLSNVDKKVDVKVADSSEGAVAEDIVTLQAGVPYNYQKTVNIPDDFEGSLSLKFGWGKMQGDNIEDNSPLRVEVSNVSFKTTASIPDSNATTTFVPKKKKITIKLGKTKIKKVKRAKRSLKFKLKKIKGASGYQIRYSDNKKFDGYWQKKVKKTKVKLKKLDRKTKYYIKARAFKKTGNVYTYGKFSKRKKAKTK